MSDQARHFGDADPEAEWEPDSTVPEGSRLVVPYEAGLARLSGEFLPFGITRRRHFPATLSPLSLSQLGLARLQVPEVANGGFRELVANFRASGAFGAMRTVMFVATERGTGVSTTAWNFANFLSEDSHTTVLYVDADLRNWRLGPDGAMPELSCLAEMAEPGCTGQLPVYAVEDRENLFVLPAGGPCASPPAVFQSRAFEAFLREALLRFTYVVFDAPPLQEAVESVLLCARVDGVILVMDGERTRRSVAQWAKGKIEGAGARLVGVVLNRRRQFIPDWLYRRL
jgi:protein-tyrosine kinase